MKNAIVKRLENPETAGEIFRTVLRKGHSQRSEVLAAITQNPMTALAALQHGHEALGLNERGAADVLEVVLEQTAEHYGEEMATQLMAMHLTSDRLAELLNGRGDLPSMSADLAPLEVVVEAVKEDMGALDARALLTLRAWAMKLKDRADYPVFLQHQVPDGTTFKQILLYALALEAGSSDIPGDLFEQVGLDPVEEQNLFEALAEEDDFPEFDEEEVAHAQASVAQRHEELERQKRKNEAQQAADDVADDLDV